MTDDNRPVDHERRIAEAQRARPAVDSQGRRRAGPTKYVYDERGLLVSATPDETD